ncbi:hypothetical protein MBOE_25320 [Mycolicibacterium boenickei]|uniref:Uncharacterized protein n=1 Tax=Mycolicibacterium boenickei TaxID=146017 RepID=A0ABN5ZAF5_9MYCO|nr:hypothetical protein MBOE_25320 [Mycolicibacterium boenickei]
MPSHGNTGIFAGGAVVPGLALIEVLPFVVQIVLVAVSWQVGRAFATGAETTDTAAKLAIKNANPRPVIMPFPFRAMTTPEVSCAARADICPLITGRPIRRQGNPHRAGCCSPRPC